MISSRLLAPALAELTCSLVGDPPTAANPNKSKKSQAAQVAAQQKATAQAVQAAQAAQAAADADVVLVTLPSLGKEVKVGTVRNRLVEPLFRGVDGGESVVEAMGRAIARAGVEGQAIWDGVGVVGDLAGITSESGFALVTCDRARDLYSSLPGNEPR